MKSLVAPSKATVPTQVSAATDSAVTNKAPGRSPGAVFRVSEGSEEVWAGGGPEGCKAPPVVPQAFFSEMGAPDIRDIAILHILGGEQK